MRNPSMPVLWTLVIGEAVLRLEPSFIETNSVIEWHKIKGFRNLIAHDYFGIDTEEVWDIVTNKIPGLKTFIQEKLKLT